MFRQGLLRCETLSHPARSVSGRSWLISLIKSAIVAMRVPFGREWLEFEGTEVGLLDVFHHVAAGVAVLSMAIFRKF